MINHLTGVLKNWYDLGLHLDIYADFLDTIDEKGDVNSQLFSMWFQTDPTPTWYKLSLALMRTGSANLSKKIINFADSG